MVEVLLVLLVTAMALALPGLFLVLRKMSMVADALSHTVILGIVLAYFLCKDLRSPWLIIGAAAFGVLTLYCIELLIQKGRVKADAATGLIFPLFFSLGVILISRYASKVHLDVDYVLMGEVIFTPFKRAGIFGISLPVALLQMLFMLILNLAFILLFYKELKLSSFDAVTAKLMGFSVVFLQYALTSLVSLTSVAAFEAVGAILVIAFLIIPAASALLLTKRLHHALLLTIAYALLNSIIGFVLALLFNVSMPGMCAVVAGASFLLTLIFRPQGMIGQIFAQKRRERLFYESLLLLHLANHEHTAQASEELGKGRLAAHIN